MKALTLATVLVLPLAAGPLLAAGSGNETAPESGHVIGLADGFLATIGKQKLPG